MNNYTEGLTFVDMESKLPVTPRHEALKKLKESRNAEQTIELYLEGTIDFDDLTDKEKEMYERQIWLMAQIKAGGKERFDRDTFLERHTKRFDISMATANRDLRFVNNQRKRLMDAELEFHKYYLLQKAFDAIELAEDEELKGMAASSMARGIIAAAKILGIDKSGQKDGGEMDNTKIEQHINIKVADARTNLILTELVDKNISVLKHSTDLKEILRLEQVALEKSQKLDPTDYETIREGTSETGD